MALKRRELIVALLLGGLAWALLARWLPLLHFVPYAFLGGIVFTLIAALCVLTLTSRGNDSNILDERRARLPGTNFVSFVAPSLWSLEIAALRQRASYRAAAIHPPAPLVSQAFDVLLDLAVHDFIRAWYQKISTGTTFPNEVDRAIRRAISEISTRVLELDMVELGVTRLLPLLNKHLRSFFEAERLVRGRDLTRNVTESEELDVAIAAKYEDGRLHPAASLAASKTTSLQQQHLRRLVARVLPHVLPEHMSTSPSVLTLIREIVAGAVLLPVMQALSDPDVLNQLVEAYGLSVLQERKTVRKLREALDEHASPSSKSTAATKLPRLTPNDTERHFERFIRGIRQCTSLTDARRFRSEIARTLKRAMSSSTEDQTYIRRLEMGKKLLDQQVERLSTRPADKAGILIPLEQPLVQRENFTLREVLLDAAGLSHFMEFMDRLSLMTLVQFWIVVDGFRGPLDYPSTDTSGNAHAYGQPRAWSDSDRQDLAQISEAYLWRPELNIPKEAQTAVHGFLDAGSNATWTQFENARNAVLTSQEDVYTRIREQHFPRFKTSDIYYKWLASESGAQPSYTPTRADTPPATESSSGRSLQKSRPVTAVRALKSKTPDLRRVAGSSSDLTAKAATSTTNKDARRSLDDSFTRRSLDEGRQKMISLEDEAEGLLAQSTQSLESDPGSARDEENRSQTIAAVQAALEELLGEERDEKTPNFDYSREDTRGLFAEPDENPSSRSERDMSELEKERPSLASLGLLGTPSRRTVFSQGNLFGEEEQSWQEGQSEDDGHDMPNDDTEIFEAAPGDLGLSELIQTLTVDIDKLEAQQAVVESLAKKADLTNNSAELRILKKSKLSLDREIHRKELQRQQYIVQESDNELYGKATVSIKSIMVGTEDDGHEFALYVIEVQRRQSVQNQVNTSSANESEDTGTVTWAIARRYSEFHELHRSLRSKYPSVRELEFPRRQMVLTLQRDFLKKRRIALEKYLRELLSRPDICRSVEFRAFLSQQAIRPISNSTKKQVDKKDIVMRIYNSVTDGVEEFLGNGPMIDHLSMAGQNLITAASNDPMTLAAGGSYLRRSISHDGASTAEAQAEIAAFESTKDPETVSFIKPICDNFLELFQLNQGNNWLRGHAVVVVVQQLLGGTIERKVRESFKAATSEESIARALTQLKDMLWPGGTFRGSPPVRSEAEKARSRREAGLVLATLLPDLAGSVVGRGTAAKAGRRIFATMNNERLNQHLVYVILDECVDIVFGKPAS